MDRPTLVRKIHNPTMLWDPFDRLNTGKNPGDSFILETEEGNFGKFYPDILFKIRGKGKVEEVLNFYKKEQTIFSNKLGTIKLPRSIFEKDGQIVKLSILGIDGTLERAMLGQYSVDGFFDPVKKMEGTTLAEYCGEDAEGGLKAKKIVQKISEHLHRNYGIPKTQLHARNIMVTQGAREGIHLVITDMAQNIPKFFEKYHTTEESPKLGSNIRDTVSWILGRQKKE